MESASQTCGSKWCDLVGRPGPRLGFPHSGWMDATSPSFSRGRSSDRHRRASPPVRWICGAWKCYSCWFHRLLGWETLGFWEQLVIPNLKPALSNSNNLQIIRFWVQIWWFRILFGRFVGLKFSRMVSQQYDILWEVYRMRDRSSSFFVPESSLWNLLRSKAYYCSIVAMESPQKWITPMESTAGVCPSNICFFHNGRSDIISFDGVVTLCGTWWVLWTTGGYVGRIHWVTSKWLGFPYQNWSFCDDLGPMDVAACQFAGFTPSLRKAEIDRPHTQMKSESKSNEKDSCIMDGIAHFGVTVDWLKLGAEDSLGSIFDIDPWMESISIS